MKQRIEEKKEELIEKISWTGGNQGDYGLDKHDVEKAIDEAISFGRQLERERVRGWANNWIKSVKQVTKEDSQSYQDSMYILSALLLALNE